MTPEAVADWWHSAIAPFHDPAVEVAVVLLLDEGDGLLGHVAASSGSRHAVAVPVRDGLRQGLILGARSLTLVHNHPGADPSPSVEDMRMTRELRAACRLLGLELKDSIILSESGDVFSFEAEGWLEQADAIRAQTAGERGHQALGGVITWMEAGHPGITTAIVETAALEDLSPEQWLGNLIIDELQRRFSTSS